MRTWMTLAVALCLAACNRDNAPPRVAPSATFTPLAAATPTPAAAVSVPRPFRVDPAAGPIEGMECEAGECYWQQKQGVTVVDRVYGGVLIKLAVRGGTSTYPDGTSIPVRWSPDIKIAWRDLTSYLFCSLRHPAMLSNVNGRYYLDGLQLYDPPSSQGAATQIYMEECHGLTSDAWNAGRLKQLGYARVGASRTIYSTLAEALKAITR